jgi:hypothetical protein
MYAMHTTALHERLPLAGFAEPLLDWLQLAGTTPQLAGSTEAMQGAAVAHHMQQSLVPYSA